VGAHPLNHEPSWSGRRRAQFFPDRRGIFLGNVLGVLRGLPKGTKRHWGMDSTQQPDRLTKRMTSAFQWLASRFPADHRGEHRRSLLLENR
jgi:hypothetical protein